VWELLEMDGMSMIVRQNWDVDRAADWFMEWNVGNSETEWE